MKRILILAAALLLGSAAGAATDPIDSLESGASSPFRVAARGVINDPGHPLHPGFVRPTAATLRVAFDPSSGEASVEIESGRGEDHDVDRYFVRRGRVFQVDDEGHDIPAAPLAEISAAAVAALHPALVANAMRENRQNVRAEAAGTYLFAWNDALWAVTTDAGAGRVVSLKRRDFDDVHGDGDEEIVYSSSPARVTVRRSGREAARFDFSAVEPVASVEIPAGDPRRDRGRAVRADQLKLSLLAPRLFTIEVASLSTRVFVAEFADHAVVIEGVYNATIGDQVVRVVKETLGKPIRYFAFSHLHAQYVGSARSFVAEGATIIVPPTTVPLIEEMVKSGHTLKPDALARAPREAKIETVPTSRRLEDATNALEIFNVVSEHTDEYFVFWLPGPKILLTGDLLFYRAGKPLTGRSKRLCRTVADLGLQPEQYVATWPLDGYGTNNIVSGEEMRAACASSP
ncbi:MAG: hypothetical protein HY049_14575 [Acidobacteria bacterium]|nr:hypothetical protein [Acidobacteriota bacterium]